jgi:ribosomal protein S18 acetylase RimI-like enzyme
MLTLISKPQYILSNSFSFTSLTIAPLPARSIWKLLYWHICTHIVTLLPEQRSMQFYIVTYRPEFSDAVVDLWKKCNLVVPQNDPITDIQKKVEFQPELFFIGLLADKVVGSIMVGYEGHRGWINYLAVTPEFQGRGYGRQLVQRGIDELSKIGCTKVNLQVRDTNKTAIDFYKHLGFKDDRVTSLGLRLLKTTQ